MMARLFSRVTALLRSLFSIKLRWPLARRAGVWAALLLTLFLLAPQDLLARRGGRISFGRSGSFSKRTYRPPSRAKTWGSSRPTSVQPRMGSRSSSRPAGSAGRSGGSGIDQAALNRARTQGTVFNSRNDAERAFQRDYANKYPTRFGSEPSARPSYIPDRTTVDGQNFDVSYNPRYGGYGYVRNGSWVMFDALRDIAILNMLMRQNAYVYRGSGSAGTGGSGSSSAGEDGNAAEDNQRGSRSGFGMGTGLAIFLLILGAWAMIPRRRGAQQYYQGKARAWPPQGPPPAQKENRMTQDLDLNSIRLWRSLKPGSTIILKDEQTLEDMIAGGEALATGRDYNVEEVWRIRESRDVAEWQFFRIRSPHDEDATWLMIKSAGDSLGAAVFFEADGFHPGNRRSLLDQELYWVFAEPRDPDNYKLLDLTFAPHLYFNVEMDGEAREAEFVKLGGLEFHGNALADPPVPNNDRMVGTVAEYETMLPVPNPKVLFFEAGVPNEEGGLIRMLQGSEIRLGDIEVLPLAGGDPS